MADDTEVVLTPLKGLVPGSHVMRIERVSTSQLDKNTVVHVAGGPYKGIIVNKASQEQLSASKPDAERVFTAYVADAKKEEDKKYSRERRELKFWYEELAKVDTQVLEALTDTYYKELMNPQAFPKDYIQFVKRVLELVKSYSAIQKLELCMRPLLEGEDDEGLVFDRTLHTRKTTVTTTTSTRTVTKMMGSGQDEFRMLADGTVVDSHGNILTEADLAKLEQSGRLIRTSHVQEDYRQQADGTYVDSHGNVFNLDLNSMKVAQGVYLLKPGSKQPYKQKKDGSIVDSKGKQLSPEALSQLERDGQLIKVGHIQEDYRRLADGTFMDSQEQIVTMDTISTSLLKGAYLLDKSGAKKGGYKQRDDGLLVDSHGNVISPEGLAKLEKDGHIVKVCRIQEDYRRVADGTYVDSRGHILTFDPMSMTMQKGAYLLKPGASQGGYQQKEDGSVLDSHGQVLASEQLVQLEKSGQLVRVCHIQEDYRRMADGTCVDSHGHYVSFDPTSMSVQQGVYLLKPGPNQEGYRQQTDGSVVDSRGKVLAPEELSQLEKAGQLVKVCHIQEDYRRLADGTCVDSHGHIVTFDPSSMTIQQGMYLLKAGPNQNQYKQMVDGSIMDSRGKMLSPEELVDLEKKGRLIKVSHSQEDYRRLADGTYSDSHGQIVSLDQSSVRMLMGNTLLMRTAASQDDFRRLADGTIVDSHGRVVSPEEYAAFVQKGGVLNRSVDGGSNVTNGLDVSFGEPNATSTTRKKQPTITRKGWDLIWATKKQRLITILEDAYPTVMTMDDLARHSSMKPVDVEYIMEDLTKRGLVKDVDKNRYIRIPQGRKLVIRQGTTARQSRQSVDMDRSMDKSMDEDTKKKNHEFKLVPHIPHLPAKDQPTIAIVTLLFCEKVAVDAMMDFKTTYIRIKKGEGEGQVYTVGKIGPHKIVSTKLSRIGHGQGAMMAAGNTVTRLLGTFGMIEHVILVGVGGGVASVSDESRHVRLGDIVASKGSSPSDPVYIHCLEMDDNPQKTAFKNSNWGPKDAILGNIMSRLEKQYMQKEFFSSDWEKYIEEGESELKGGETRYSRPPAESDKLYKVENNKEIELDHPMSPKGSARNNNPNKPFLWLGKIGSGKQMSKEHEVRQAFTAATDTVCIDSGFQAVMESIEGNRKDSFAVIRGIADYQDGTHRRDWQPYAALVAAAFMKAVILEISHKSDSDDED